MRWRAPRRNRRSQRRAVRFGWRSSEGTASIRFAARALLIGLLLPLLGVDGAAGFGALASLPFYAVSLLLFRLGRDYEVVLVVGDTFLLFSALHGAPPGLGIEALVPIWLIGAAFTTLRRASLQRMPLLALVAAAALLAHALLSGAGAGYLLAQGALLLFAAMVATALIAERGENRRDGLTGVLTRSAGIAELTRRLARADGGQRVAFVDLAGFKAINDRHGHPLGDQVLKLVAQRLTAEVRREDIVFRYGGDEFVVVGSSPDLATRLNDVFAAPFVTAAGPLRITARVGLMATAEEADVAAVLAEADRRMYAQRRGATGD